MTNIKNKCKHEWEGQDFYQNNGIVFKIYRCSICNKKIEQCIGETWKPDINGNF